MKDTDKIRSKELGTVHIVTHTHDNAPHSGKRQLRREQSESWYMIEGNWFYFNPVSDGTRGALYVNRTTPDGYAVGADGVWQSQLPVTCDFCCIENRFGL